MQTDDEKVNMKMDRKSHTEKRTGFKSYDELPLVLEVKDIQNILGISRTTAYHLVNEKGFPTFRSGNRIKVSKRALFDWMEGKA